MTDRISTTKDELVLKVARFHISLLFHWMASVRCRMKPQKSAKSSSNQYNRINPSAGCHSLTQSLNQTSYQQVVWYHRGFQAAGCVISPRQHTCIYASIHPSQTGRVNVSGQTEGNAKLLFVRGQPAIETTYSLAMLISTRHRRPTGHNVEPCIDMSWW